MDPEKKPLLKWFGYSRRERRSTFILFIIILITIAIRYLVPDRDQLIEEVTANRPDIFEYSGTVKNIADTLKPFNFDPNQASFTTLVSLGLSQKQAKTVLNFRNKGGRFRKPSDISKIYGISDEIALKLFPYIIIGKDSLISQKTVPYNKQKIDLNNCDTALLNSLPGIGPVLSLRIIKYRNLLGGFASKGQLKEVYGLPGETYNMINDRVFTDSAVIKRININEAEYRDLIKHPYFEKYDVEAILKYRKIKGRISGMTELTGSKILSDEKAKKIKPYLIF
jgi:competence protein ComEA